MSISKNITGYENMETRNALKKVTHFAEWEFNQKRPSSREVKESIDVILERNFISMNYLYGCIFTNSSLCDIIDNYLYTNHDGVKTEYSNYNNIIGNNLEYHENAIHLSYSSFNIIMNNYGANNINEIIENNCQNNLFENNFPQQEVETIITKIDVTIIIVFSISFFPIVYIVVNVYRYRKLSKPSSL